MITATLLLLAQAVDPASTPVRPLAAPRAAAPSASTCDAPVIMVVAGPTRDRARMLAYGQAIADSKLYQQLGGYYLNAPRAVDRFEGEPPPGYTTLMVRFPCLENARAFWHSEATFPGVSLPSSVVRSTIETANRRPKHFDFFFRLRVLNLATRSSMPT